MSARHLRAARLAGHGLPGRLPPGERLLWQGSPSAPALIRHAFHLRLLAGYFAVMLAASAISAASHGAVWHGVAGALLARAGLAAVPLLLIAAYAWAVGRSTTYTITTHRVVFSFGIALPVKFNIPFARIAGAGLCLHGRGAGDIPLRLQPGEKLSYFVMWPHARPWRLAATQPMLRCVLDAEEVARILADALAQHAGGCMPAAETMRASLRAGEWQGQPQAA